VCPEDVNQAGNTLQQNSTPLFKFSAYPADNNDVENVLTGQRHAKRSKQLPLAGSREKQVPRFAHKNSVGRSR
jgi:hypothetical protein